LIKEPDLERTQQLIQQIIIQEYPNDEQKDEEDNNNLEFKINNTNFTNKCGGAILEEMQNSTEKFHLLIIPENLTLLHLSKANFQILCFTILKSLFQEIDNIFLSIIEIQDHISVILNTSIIENNKLINDNIQFVQILGEWKLIQFCDSIHFSANQEPGLMACLSRPLYNINNIPVLGISSYETDYILVLKSEFNNVFPLFQHRFSIL